MSQGPARQDVPSLPGWQCPNACRLVYTPALTVLLQPTAAESQGELCSSSNGMSGPQSQAYGITGPAVSTAMYCPILVKEVARLVPLVQQKPLQKQVNPQRLLRMNKASQCRLFQRFWGQLGKLVAVYVQPVWAFRGWLAGCPKRLVDPYYPCIANASTTD